MEKCAKDKNRDLLNGTLIYFVGNVLTQIVSIILLRLITGEITTEDYGYFNLIVTVDNLITPMITLQISDAVFYFILRARTPEEKNRIYSTGTSVIVIGIIITILIVNLLYNIMNLRYPLWISLYVISTNIFAYVQKMVRSMGQNKIYVIANLLKSIIYFALIILFIVVMDMDVKGLLMANTIATYLCIIIIEIQVKMHHMFGFKSIKYDCLKKMIKFSAPLIPNTAVWWMQSSVNMIIITTQIGLDYNGIYSVSLKFANILNLVITVFNLAWQESSIVEYGNKGYREFATNILNKYICFLLSAVAVLIPILKIVAPFLVNEEYGDAVIYIPYLTFSTVFSAVSGYFAQIITAKNKNEKLLVTNLLGAFSNIVIVFLGVKKFGIWIVIFSSIITSLLVSVARFYEVRMDLDNKRIEVKKIGILVAMCIIGCLVYTYVNDYFINTLNLLIVLIVCVYVNRNLICDIVGAFLNKIK